MNLATLRIGLAALLLAACSAVSSQPTAYKPVDAQSRFNKIIGEVSQLKDGNLVGNAWFYGKDGCHVVTNFHVAFGKTKKIERHKVTGEEFERVLLVDNPARGHRTRLNFDFDPKSQAFSRSVVAEVVAFGNYEQGSIAGIREDIALLRLEQCAGPEYAGLDMDRADENQKNPPGRMMIFSSLRSADGKVLIGSFEGCRATVKTPGAGLVGSSCPTHDGMSGSMMISEDTMRIVGLNVSRFQYDDGTKAGIAVSAKYLNKFLDEHMAAVLK